MNYFVQTYKPCQSVFTAVKVLQDQDVPHNMMITYGDPCTPAPETDVPQPVLRVCLWPVKPSDQVIHHFRFYRSLGVSFNTSVLLTIPFTYIYHETIISLRGR